MNEQQANRIIELLERMDARLASSSAAFMALTDTMATPLGIG
jgi:hypothetical protein